MTAAITTEDEARRTRVDAVAAAAQRWLERQDPVRWVLAGAIAVWFLTFTILTWQRHDRFGTFGFDLGIYDQAIWLMSQLKDPFITVRGLEFFGHHVNPILVLFAPFYRLGAGPHFLLIVQVLAQASGAVAVFLLARDRILNRWLAVALAAVYLIHPTSGWLVWEFFHPDALAIAPLLFAYWAARREKWGWFAAAGLVALFCKEDVALPLMVIGVLVAVRIHRRLGVLTAVAALVWFEICNKVILPYSNGIGAFYSTFFGDLGTSPAGILKTVILHPSRPLRLLRMKDRESYMTMTLAPLAFLPLLSLDTFLIALPMLAINLLSTFPYQREIRYHYAALVFVGVIIATVEAIARFNAIPALQRFLVALVAAAALAGTVAWGNSPMSVKFHSGVWALGHDSRIEAKQAALRMIPPRQSASVIYYMTPHLTHRTKVYEFPVPWKPTNWGVKGENLDNPDGVDWLLLDRQLLGTDDRQLLDNLLQDQFVVRFDRDDIVVAQRVRRNSPTE